MPLNFTLKVTAAIIMIQKETLSITIIYEPKSKQLVEMILHCENHGIERVVSISDCHGNSLKNPYSFHGSHY